MTGEVCNDLRQWLQQLALVLSFYHIFILDSENEKGRLRDKLARVEEKKKHDEDSCSDALRRSKATEQRWEEFKMKRRAEALLGLNLEDQEEEKIYSQREMEELYQKWMLGVKCVKELQQFLTRSEKYVNPLLDELEELRKQLDIRPSPSKRRTMGGEEANSSPTGSQQLSEQRMLCGALFAASERSPEPLGDLLWQLGDRLKAGESYKDIALAIQALPHFNPHLDEDAHLLDQEDWREAASTVASPSLGQELQRLERLIGATTREELPEVVQALQALAAEAAVCARESGAKAARRRSVAVNTSQAMVLPSAPAVPEAVAVSAASEDAEHWRRELERLRAQLEAELKAAREEAERQRLRAEEPGNAEEALRRLEEEAKRADGLMEEMRKKMEQMQEMLHSKGLGKAVEAALAAAGLTSFCRGRDVFERLYRDALRRMREVPAEGTRPRSGRAKSSPALTVSRLWHALWTKALQFFLVLRVQFAESFSNRRCDLAVLQAAEFQNIIHSAGVPIIELDKHSCITQWNARIAELTGIPREQVLGKENATSGVEQFK
eukprot:g8090.t1